MHHGMASCIAAFTALQRSEIPSSRPEGNMVTAPAGLGGVGATSTDTARDDLRHHRPGWADGGFDTLSEQDFESIQALTPEIVLLGTGARQRFPHPRLYRALTDAGIGVEIMDSAAAARTYNIIAAEGRRVAAALILP